MAKKSKSEPNKNVTLFDVDKNLARFGVDPAMYEVMRQQQPQSPAKTPAKPVKSKKTK